MATQQGVPGIPQAAMVDEKGNPTGPWFSFFVNLWTRTGGATGTLSAILDNISSIPGALLYRGQTLWSGLSPASRFEVLRMGPEFPEWDFLDGNSFGHQAANMFLVSPSGVAGIPSFRDITSLDLDPIAGQFPGTATDDNANAGNIGEFDSATAPATAPVGLTTSVASTVASILLSPGDWDVWGVCVFTFGASTTTTLLITSVNSGTPKLLETGATVQQVFPSFHPSGDFSVPAPPTRFSLAAATTMNLTAVAAFATSTCAAYGSIYARRAR